MAKWSRYCFTSLGVFGCTWAGGHSTGVHRSDSMDTLMQEERAHFRVDANGGESGAPFCLFEFASVWGVV